MRTIAYASEWHNRLHRRGISLRAIPSLPALFALDEMSVDERGRALKAGDFSEIVILRPIVELNSSSLLDEVSRCTN